MSTNTDKLNNHKSHRAWEIFNMKIDWKQFYIQNKLHEFYYHQQDFKRRAPLEYFETYGDLNAILSVIYHTFTKHNKYNINNNTQYHANIKQSYDKFWDVAIDVMEYAIPYKFDPSLSGVTLISFMYFLHYGPTTKYIKQQYEAGKLHQCNQFSEDDIPLIMDVPAPFLESASSLYAFHKLSSFYDYDYDEKSLYNNYRLSLPLDMKILSTGQTFTKIIRVKTKCLTSTSRGEYKDVLVVSSKGNILINPDVICDWIDQSSKQLRKKKYPEIDTTKLPKPDPSGFPDYPNKNFPDLAKDVFLSDDLMLY